MVIGVSKRESSNNYCSLVLSQSCLALSWDQAEREIIKLAQKINFSVDLIVGIARGGLVPATIISRVLNIEEIHSLKMRRINGKRELLTHLDNDLNGKKVLLIDDMSESGGTLLHAQQYLESKGAIVKTACLYSLATNSSSPDYFLKTIPELIQFPWD